MSIVLSARQVAILSAMVRAVHLEELNDDLSERPMPATNAEELAAIFKIEANQPLSPRLQQLAQSASAVTSWKAMIAEMDKKFPADPLTTFEIVALTQLLWS